MAEHYLGCWRGTDAHGVSDVISLMPRPGATLSIAAALIKELHDIIERHFILPAVYFFRMSEKQGLFGLVLEFGGAAP